MLSAKRTNDEALSENLHLAMAVPWCTQEWPCELGVGCLSGDKPTRHATMQCGLPVAQGQFPAPGWGSMSVVVLVCGCPSSSSWSRALSREAFGASVGEVALILLAMSPLLRVVFLQLFLASTCVSGESLIAFDSAAASSTYGGGAFTADAAISKGSGYWCRWASDGALHPWFGEGEGECSPCFQRWQPCCWAERDLDWYARRAAEGFGRNDQLVGLRYSSTVMGQGCVCCVLGIGRAYGPGEYKVMTSADGGNFQEAACWRSASRKEVSYGETLMFDSARSVQALTLAMRSPMPWGFFGLNDISLIVEPGPMMLISGSPSEAGERCVVSLQGSAGSEDCLRVIAAGDGREVFSWSEESQIMSMREGKCVSLTSGAAEVGALLALQDCTEALEAGDGRSVFELTNKGQLRFKRMGNYCLVASPDGLRAQDCGAADEDAGARDKFFVAAVPELDLAPAAAAADVSVLLQAAAARQAVLLAELREAMPRLEACKLSLGTNSSHVGQPVVLGKESLVASSLREGDAVMQAISEMYSSLGIDMFGIKKLIADTSGTLAGARAKAALAA